jgi:Xaa-Pro dipeptidase
MPCGLGHFVGLDCHDVGGYLQNNPKRDMQPGLRNLRTCRTMQKDMCITIEPGIYFRPFLFNGELDKSYHDFDLSVLNVDKIREYNAEVGGVRIEDVLIITDTGCENLSADIPREVE